MTVGLYPRQHKIYQDYLIKQIKIAKNRISHFPLLDQIVENFKGYENLRWKESRNKIFIESTIKPQRFPVEIFDYLPKNHKNKKILKLKPFVFDENEGNFPYSLLDAEDAVNLLIRERWNKRQQKEFAKRLKDYDYFTSNSAYSELMTAYEFGKIVGFDNIILNPTLSSKKNSDIFLRINGTDIYFELTEPRPKESENKIQRIFDDFAEFLGDRFGNKKYVLTIFVNTLYFPKDKEGHIDEIASKKFLKQWSQKIRLDKLIDSNALIQLGYEFYSVDGAKFLGELVEKSYLLSPDILKLIREQPLVKEWADCVYISDLNSCPFHAIGIHPEEKGPHVEIKGNISYPSQIGELEEKSFFTKIEKSINGKIKQGQFERGKPAIIMIKAKFWANMFESDNSDFLKIQKIIKNELQDNEDISGVLIYYTHFKNGKYVNNIHVRQSARIHSSILKKLGMEKISTS